MWRVLAVLPAVALAGCWPMECEPTTYESSRATSIREDDPLYAQEIADCFAEDYACERLCARLLGPPPDGTSRDGIVECYVNRDGTGGLAVSMVQRLTSKCYAEPDADWGWDWPIADAQPVPDAWQDIDATPPDAEPADASR